MAQETAQDKWGNEIYLTDERWRHIVETHDEMIGHRGHIFTTLRGGNYRRGNYGINSSCIRFRR